MRKQFDDVRISIGTWEERGGLLRVGFQVTIERDRIQEPVGLTREETRQLLNHEEECSR